jgi:hypothetical protein
MGKSLARKSKFCTLKASYTVSVGLTSATACATHTHTHTLALQLMDVTTKYIPCNS